jgi:hypothetical protein
MCQKLSDMLRAQANASIDPIAAVLEPLFTARCAPVYALYCAGQTASSELYNTLMKSEPYFMLLMRKIEAHAECHRLKFMDFNVAVCPSCCFAFFLSFHSKARLMSSFLLCVRAGDAAADKVSVVGGGHSQVHPRKGRGCVSVNCTRRCQDNASAGKYRRQGKRGLGASCFHSGFAIFFGTFVKIFLKF